MDKIVTHPGTAHKDEFFAACVLLACVDDCQLIERREATSEDLSDPSVWVIDVGMELAPERHNFDHHQDESLPCAFHLVMQHLGFHQGADEVFGWYARLSMMDVRGPYRTAEELGVDSRVLFASSSPLDGFILSWFSSFDQIEKGSLIYRFMLEFGRDLITMIELKSTRLERLKKEIEVVEIGAHKVIFSRIADQPKLSMELYLRHLDDDSVVMSILPSSRGSGWELVRLHDSRVVDFNVLRNRKEIRFVHKAGFVAKTYEMLERKELLCLVRDALQQ